MLSQEQQDVRGCASLLLPLFKLMRDRYLPDHKAVAFPTGEAVLRCTMLASPQVRHVHTEERMRRWRAWVLRSRNLIDSNLFPVTRDLTYPMNPLHADRLYPETGEQRRERQLMLLTLLIGPDLVVLRRPRDDTELNYARMFYPRHDTVMVVRVLYGDLDETMRQIRKRLRKSTQRMVAEMSRIKVRAVRSVA